MSTLSLLEICDALSGISTGLDFRYVDLPVGDNLYTRATFILCRRKSGLLNRLFRCISVARKANSIFEKLMSNVIETVPMSEGEVLTIRRNKQWIGDDVLCIDLNSSLESNCIGFDGKTKLYNNYTSDRILIRVMYE